MLIVFLLLVAQSEINTIVGSEIDSIEARKYHLFTDIVGFESARFSEEGDSVITTISFRPDTAARESTVTIDARSFSALRSYISNFRMIIEDREFRQSFVQTFPVGWPIVTRQEIDHLAGALKLSDCGATFCCLSGGCALGAYTAALLTRDTWVETTSVAVPCFIGHQSCLIEVPIIREFYTFDELPYAAGAAVGSGLGYLWARSQRRARDILSYAIGHDIVAFDHADFPITEAQVSAANRGTNEMLLGTLGLGLGLLGAGVTMSALYAPWADKIPDEPWQDDAIGIAVTVVSVTELAIIVNFFINKGRQLDRRATLERLQNRQD